MNNQSPVSPGTERMLEAEQIKSSKIFKTHGKKTLEYIAWFREAVHQSPEETMRMMMQHTNQWAAANVIVGELESMAEAMSRKHKHGPLGKTHMVVHPAEQAVLKRVFIAKILHELAEGSDANTGIGFTSSEVDN